MKRALLLDLLSFLVTAVAPKRASAGAWLQKKDGGYVKLTCASFRTSTVLDHNGDTVGLNAGGISSGDYTDLSFNTYLEYGLHERITLIANVPIKRASKADATRSASVT